MPKNALLFSTIDTNSDTVFFSKDDVVRPAHAFCYIGGVEIDPNLSFEDHLNSVLSKNAY